MPRSSVSTPARVAGPWRLLLLAAALGTALGRPAGAPQEPRVTGPRPWIWIGPSEIRNLPMSGAEWDARGAPWFQNRGVHYYAQQDTTSPCLGDNDDDTDVYVLAKALVWLRLKVEAQPPEDPEPYRRSVQEACLAARGTELLGPDSTTLSLGRNLFAFVVAASIIDWDDSVPGRREADFRGWLTRVRHEFLHEGLTSFRTLVHAHERRPNNWGLMCGASRLAAAVYLGDGRDERRCWDVFRRWLGDTTSPFDFAPNDWGALSWQADIAHPVGINPAQSSKLDCQGVLRSLDGVIPDDMRRTGHFDARAPCDLRWSWPCYTDRAGRNYSWSAMQAVLAQAVVHGRRGRVPWSVGTSAIARACDWLYQELQFPVTDPAAGDDDYWIPCLVNQVYPALALPELSGTKPGHQVGFTDWTTLEPSWP